MRHHFVVNHNSRKLIVIFAGWAMDFRPFQSLRAEGYDILIVWDYVSTEFNGTVFKGYEEIVITAWSFGVTAASKFIHENPSLPITARIAVNGTQHPVDDSKGIPEAVFNATLDNLSPESLPRFYRRMAGSSASFREFMEICPQRDIASLREELKSIARRDPVIISWDLAITGVDDRIIPHENQLRAWTSEAARTVTLPSPHLPDFSFLLKTYVTDKSLVAQRFGNALNTYDSNAEVQHSIAARLVEMWNPAYTVTPDMIEIGCGTGYSTSLYLRKINPRSLQLWDLTISPNLPENCEKVECDAEARLFTTPSSSADVIFSSSTVQWFNSLPAFFRNASRVLRQGGLLVISTFGPDNFKELNTILASGKKYPSTEEITAMLPDDLEVVRSESELREMKFDDVTAMLRHISLTGVNALSRNASLADTRKIMHDYPRQTDGSVSLIYNPIYLIIKKK
ncbi:MAG: DUF452 family protein [Duncaniella sp.]|nr:DUF452 family protein [Duncaniella sp.]